MLLKDSIPLVRLLAAMALERIGTRDGLNEAVACLSRALGEPSAWYHGLALRSLVAIAVDDERKVSGVSDALEEYRAVQILGLKHRDIKTRREAARVLSNMGEGAEPAVEPLVAALEDRDIVVRGYSVAALRNSKNAAAESALARSAKRLVKDFIREIEGGDPAAARDAAFSLSQMGEAGVAAGPSLLPLMENRDKTLRRAAARALGGIVAPGSIPALTKALRDKDWGVRMNAARALGSFGSAAAEAAPQLVKLLTTKDVELRRAMAFHLR
jgi:HEAT repeat protein